MLRLFGVWLVVEQKSRIVETHGARSDKDSVRASEEVVAIASCFFTADERARLRIGVRGSSDFSVDACGELEVTKGNVFFAAFEIRLELFARFFGAEVLGYGDVVFFKNFFALASCSRVGVFECVAGSRDFCLDDVLAARRCVVGIFVRARLQRRVEGRSFGFATSGGECLSFCVGSSFRCGRCEGDDFGVVGDDATYGGIGKGAAFCGGGEGDRCVHEAFVERVLLLGCHGFCCDVWVALSDATSSCISWIVLRFC